MTEEPCAKEVTREKYLEVQKQVALNPKKYIKLEDIRKNDSKSDVPVPLQPQGKWEPPKSNFYFFIFQKLKTNCQIGLNLKKHWNIKKLIEFVEKY